MFKSYLQRNRETYDDIREVIDDKAVRIEVFRQTNSGVSDPGFDGDNTKNRVDIIRGRVDELDGNYRGIDTLAGSITEQLYLGTTTSNNVQKADEWVLLGKTYIVDSVSDGDESHTEAILRRLR